jgi:hypothetical protein
MKPNDTTEAASVDNEGEKYARYAEMARAVVAIGA